MRFNRAQKEKIKEKISNEVPELVGVRIFFVPDQYPLCSNMPG
jgi:hypothetical protein